MDARCHLGHVDLGHGRGRGAILAVVINPARKTHAFIGKMRWPKGPCADAETDVLGDRVLQAVPVRHKAGQPRGHAFQRRQPEGFLNVVDHEQENIGARQGGAALFGLGAIEEEKAHIRHEACRPLGEDVLGIGMTEHAAKDDVQLLARLELLLGGLHGEEDRQGVEFLMRGQPGDGGKDHVVGAAAETAAQIGAGGVVAGKVVDMHAKRDDRQQGTGRRLAAKAVADMGVDQVELRGNRGPHGP